MALTNIGSTTTPTTVTDYTVSLVAPESPTNIKENYHYNSNFTKYFSHYKKIAKIKKAIDGYSTFIVGQGFTTDTRNQVILEHVSGSGKDTFLQILKNMINVKKIGGDAYTEIIRDKDTGILINLKPLNPQNVREVYDEFGVRFRYDLMKPSGKEPITKFKPEEILHFSNNRIVDEMGGTSDIEAVIWNVEASDEAKQAHRKMVKRNGIIRVIEVDTDDTTKIAAFKTQWKTAIDNGDVLIIPKQVAEAKDWHGNLDTAGVVAWLDYLDNDFYMSIGVPRVILGGAENSIEASSKIGTLNFEQYYDLEHNELEAAIWNQLAIRIKFNKPASLMDVGGAPVSAPNDMQQNQSQTGFQPSDVQAGAGQ